MAAACTVKEVFLPGRKRIALVAHDNRKTDLIDWARFNVQTLTCHELHSSRSRTIRMSRHCCW